MKTTLLLWFVPVTLLMVGLIVARFKLNQRQRLSSSFVDLGVDVHGAPAEVGEPT